MSLLCFTFYEVLSPIVLVKMAKQMTLKYVYRGTFCKLVKQMELHKT